MSSSKLKAFIQQFHPISDEEWAFFCSRLRQTQLPGKQKLISAGQVENHVHFIEHGIVRYYIEKDDKDITFEIAFENGFACGYDSFLTRTPILYSGEALVDTVLWSITYEDLQEVYAHSRVGDKIGRLAAERLYLRKNMRQMSLLQDTAEQRYIRLLEDQLQFVQTIPLKYLASYIGITPQALSRIRKRISR